MWRLWTEGKASLAELDTLSILDVLKANEVLDAWHEAERIANEKARDR